MDAAHNIKNDPIYHGRLLELRLWQRFTRHFLQEAPKGMEG